MNVSFGYPFAAVVGEEPVKRALLCALVNTRLPSVLVSGPRGTAKTVLLRGLAALAPEKNMSLLPLNATDDRVFGGVDFEQTIRHGVKTVVSGLVVEANNGVLIADDFHLLRPEITQGVWQTLANGYNQLEREGVSERSEADFLLVAGMTPEEAELDGVTLDKFALAAGCQTTDDPAVRSEIIRRRLAYERDGAAFWQAWLMETDKLRQQVAEARKIVTEVEASEAMLQLAVKRVTEVGCEGHRAEIYLIEAARALAALAQRTYVLPDDVEEAALYVLWHRQRENQPDRQPQPPEEENEPNDASQDQQDEPDNTPPDDNREEEPQQQAEQPNEETQDENDNDNDDGKEQEQQPPEGTGGQDETAAIGQPLPIQLLFARDSRDRKVHQGCGKRTRTRTDKMQGRYVRASNHQDNTNDLAIDATLRAAAPSQKARGWGTGLPLVVKKDDFRQKIREKRTGTTFIFIVDASGSMGAKKRMSAVKGAILAMLLDAYQKRDRVSLVAFRRQTAEVLLPVTRSIELAERCLAALPTGGRTPLAAGIICGGEILQQVLRQDASADPVLILITDGRANQVTDGDPIEEAMTAAQNVGLLNCRSLVLDTEMDWPRLGAAGSIAQKMGAAYRTLEDISSDNIVRLIHSV